MSDKNLQMPDEEEWGQALEDDRKDAIRQQDWDTPSLLQSGRMMCAMQEVANLGFNSRIVSVAFGDQHIVVGDSKCKVCACASLLHPKFL